MSSLIGRLFHFRVRFPQEAKKIKNKKGSKIIVHDKIKKIVYEKSNAKKV
jgi:hypothetical protein